MTTLSTMKSRIADDLARSDLTSQIASCITTAIEEYQDTRFFFNESRDVTFSTVADQEFYTSSDNANIPDLIHIDFATILFGATDLRTLERRRPQELDYSAGNTSSTNQPYSYSYYDQKIRLYPKPSSASWTVRIHGQVLAAAPASDDETDNPWMTYAEKLIRSKAKYELAMDVLGDEALAVRMRTQEDQALTNLKNRTTKQLARGRIRSY